MKIIFIDNIQDCSADDWNKLWRHTCKDRYPFLRHEFLAALENSGSVDNHTVKDTGWRPHHLLVFNDNQLSAALPLYIKSHSWGEYVFDFVWAEAYERAALEYYPKLINAVPFTPCSGPRLLHNSLDTSDLWNRISSTLDSECQNLRLSGWHSLFLPESQSTHLQPKYPQRLGCQFHWFNQKYHSFNDFLSGMTSRKRKAINKERRQIQQQGIVFKAKTGTDISFDDWRQFHHFYQITYAKRSGHGGYLSEEFFHSIGETMSDNIVLISAFDNSGQIIAAALNFRSDNCLYGRYWGCLQEYNFLHFETCYYQGIDYAIKEGLQRFDAGAQGEHKIARGFEPIFTYSNHAIVEPRFTAPINDFIRREAIEVKHYQADACSYLPFKEIHE